MNHRKRTNGEKAARIDEIGYKGLFKKLKGE
jgi:hypothetical protein